jgi:putative Mn2+ efflux pump MntP
VELPVVLGIAVALAMDAFAVAIGASVVLGRPDARQVFRMTFHFGLFQALMPVLGWAAGLTVAHAIQAVDHWIAFGLLALVGGHMIREGLAGSHPEQPCADPTRGLTLVVLAIATSIDALAVGLSLALVGVSIAYPAVVIGLVAAAFTFVGLRIGTAVGTRIGHRASVAGGLILLLIGLRILNEHMHLV